MKPRFWSLFLASLLGFIGLGYWLPALGQAPAPETPAAITLPFNVATDNRANHPTSRGQSDQPYDDGRLVIGPDERAPVFTREFPWAAIGRLDWTLGEQSWPQCTATLIGPDLILTKSHCLIFRYQDSATGEDQEVFFDSELYSANDLRLVFKPGMIKGVALDEATVESFETGWTAESQAPANDWALMKLDQPLGAADQYGYLGWVDLDFNDPDVLSAVSEKILLAGYAGDFPTTRLEAEFGNAGDTAGVDRACSILGTVANDDYFSQISQRALNNTLIHDCDTYPGASGGPIFALFEDGNYYIVGLHARGVSLLEGDTATLPNGVVTGVVNGGVLVSRWAPQASAMLN